MHKFCGLQPFRETIEDFLRNTVFFALIWSGIGLLTRLLCGWIEYSVSATLHFELVL